MLDKCFLLLIVLLTLNSQVILEATEVKSVKVKRASDKQCGIAVNGAGLIFDGTFDDRGAWPWLIALTKQTVSPPSFFCGAVLISQTKALTGEVDEH